MFEIDCDTVDSNIGALPEGKYKCVVEQSTSKLTASGMGYIELKMTVEAGEHAGKNIFDRLFGTEKALPRLKFVCEHFGFNMSTGRVKIVPEMFVGKKAIVEVVHEEYEAQDGSMKKRSTIPYAGYERYTNAPSGHVVHDNLPPAAADNVPGLDEPPF